MNKLNYKNKTKLRIKLSNNQSPRRSMLLNPQSKEQQITIEITETINKLNHKKLTPNANSNDDGLN